jgi:tetratricopeptide (TPR) repeat protein
MASVAFSLLAASASAQSVEPDRRLAEMHYKNGLSLMRAESWDEAADEFKAAYGLDNQMAMAYYNLGQCRMSQKRYDEAAAAYKQCKQCFANLNRLSTKERNARDRERRDEIQELKNELTRVHTYKGINVEAYVTRTEDRIRVLESLQFKDSDRIEPPGEISLALGSAFFRLELLPEAEREYKEAVSLNGKLGAAHNNLAVIYMLTGRVEEANSAMKLAEKNGFRVNPRFKDDLKNLMASQR